MLKFVLASLLLIASANARLLLQDANVTWGNDVRHGPCVMGMTGLPNDLDEDWTFAFSRLQKDLPQNPSKAKYGDNWELVMQSEPGVAAAWRTGLKSIIGSLDYTNQTVSGLDYAAPFTRLCVPSPLGLSRGLLPDDWQVHFNPYGAGTDYDGNLFFKAFIRGGQVLPPGLGRSMH